MNKFLKILNKIIFILAYAVNCAGLVLNTLVLFVVGVDYIAIGNMIMCAIFIFLLTFFGLMKRREVR
jgi:hypothetical protein